jgi:hypothetical protein
LGAILGVVVRVKRSKCLRGSAWSTWRRGDYIMEGDLGLATGEKESGYPRKLLASM